MVLSVWPKNNVNNAKTIAFTTMNFQLNVNLLFMLLSCSHDSNNFQLQYDPDDLNHLKQFSFIYQIILY